jgi:hypothetical protein
MPITKLEAGLHYHRARNPATFVINPRSGDSPHRAAAVENRFRSVASAYADIQKGHDACCADGRRHQYEHFPFEETSWNNPEYYDSKVVFL